MDRRISGALDILDSAGAAGDAAATVVDRDGVAQTRPEPQPALALTERQVTLLRLALRDLLVSPGVAEPVAAELQALDERLRAASDMPPADAPPADEQPGADGPWPATGAGPRIARQAIQPGYPVFARHVDPANDFDLGQFVGVVDDVIESRPGSYLHVRGGLDQARELFLPLGAVRAAVGHQVRLNLTPTDLVGEAWHQPPTRLRAG